eukprot:1158747-Pelagomonas_calceolata.AAC.5
MQTVCLPACCTLPAAEVRVNEPSTTAVQGVQGVYCAGDACFGSRTAQHRYTLLLGQCPGQLKLRGGKAKEVRGPKATEAGRWCTLLPGQHSTGMREDSREGALSMHTGLWLGLPSERFFKTHSQHLLALNKQQQLKEAEKQMGHHITPARHTPPQGWPACPSGCSPGTQECPALWLQQSNPRPAAAGRRA